MVGKERLGKARSKRTEEAPKLEATGARCERMVEREVEAEKVGRGIYILSGQTFCGLEQKAQQSCARKLIGQRDKLTTKSVRFQGQPCRKETLEELVMVLHFAVGRPFVPECFKRSLCG